MAQRSFQAVVNSPDEADFFRSFLGEQGFDVDVQGPFAKSVFDLKDVSTGTVVKAANCWIVLGVKDMP